MTGLARRLNAFGPVRRQIIADWATETIHLIEQSFNARANPYGKAWAPRVTAGGGHPLLEKSGAMRGGFQAEPTARGIRMFNVTQYWVYHQSGTRNMVARKTLPDRGLPALWRATYQKVARQRLQSWIRGR